MHHMQVNNANARLILTSAGNKHMTTTDRMKGKVGGWVRILVGGWVRILVGGWVRILVGGFVAKVI